MVNNNASNIVLSIGLIFVKYSKLLYLHKLFAVYNEQFLLFELEISFNS